MIEPTRIFALRHGQTAWNAERRLQGQLDIPLDETGRWQAAQLAQALADESLAAVYSSDLQRAHETALALGNVAGLSVQITATLRERGFGHLEGHTYDEIEVRFPLDARHWRQRDLHFAPGGGEPLAAFHERCVTAVARLAAAHRGQSIAVVAHGGVLDCLYRQAVGVALDAPRTWQLGNAAINRLLYTGDGFALVGWSDTAHLDAGPAA